MSAFPEAVLSPPPGVKYGNFLNDITPMVSLVYLEVAGPTHILKFLSPRRMSQGGIDDRHGQNRCALQDRMKRMYSVLRETRPHVKELLPFTWAGTSLVLGGDRRFADFCQELVHNLPRQSDSSLVDADKTRARLQRPTPDLIRGTCEVSRGCHGTRGRNAPRVSGPRHRRSTPSPDCCCLHNRLRFAPIPEPRTICVR